MTDEQLESYFAGIGIDYKSLNEEQRNSIKDTTSFKIWALGVAWKEFGLSLKECADKIKDGFSKAKV